MPEINPQKVKIAELKKLIERNQEKYKSAERLLERAATTAEVEALRLEMSSIEATLTNLNAQLSGLLS